MVIQQHPDPDYRRTGSLRRGRRREGATLRGGFRKVGQTALLTRLIDQALRFDSDGRSGRREGDDPFPDLNRFFGARRLRR